MIIQRVSGASVEVDYKMVSNIHKGLVILLGIQEADTVEDILFLIQKIINLRIFNDANGTMNLSLKQVDGDVLVISQFTLLASTKKGNRPSFMNAAKPEQALPLYEKFITNLELAIGKPIATGVFGAHMKLALVNDGPVTIWMDSRNRERGLKG